MKFHTFTSHSFGGVLQVHLFEGYTSMMTKYSRNVSPKKWASPQMFQAMTNFFV